MSPSDNRQAAAKGPGPAARRPPSSPGPPAPAASPAPPAPPARFPPSAPSAPSAWRGFHRLDAKSRAARLQESTGLDDADLRTLQEGGLDGALASTFIENHLGSFALPLGVAVGFVVDGREVVVPMAVEESSVVAAASNGAKMAAQGGGFRTQVDEPVMVGQVEVRQVRDPAAALRLVQASAASWSRQLDKAIPSMVSRGGGMRGIEARWLGDRLVVHLLVDCRDAMGANLVNTLCEAFAPILSASLQESGAGGEVGLRILSNLADHRLARATLDVPVVAVGGIDVARAIVEADRFAHLDPFRAATHNKGILNGVDPVAIATGNDWRAIEAGAHAWAARDGRYAALTRYEVVGGRLKALLEMPMALGTVGGVTRLHPAARACLRLMGNPDARRLAAVMVSVGLAQNLAALRALATTGIQAGHMALHAGNLALAATLVPAASAKPRPKPRATPTAGPRAKPRAKPRAEPGAKPGAKPKRKRAPGKRSE